VTSTAALGPVTVKSITEVPPTTSTVATPAAAVRHDMDPAISIPTTVIKGAAERRALKRKPESARSSGKKDRREERRTEKVARREERRTEKVDRREERRSERKEDKKWRSPGDSGKDPFEGKKTHHHHHHHHSEKTKRRKAKQGTIKFKAPQTAVTGKKFTFTDMGHAEACEEHYEYKGQLSPEDCAKECYNTYGCLRFSAGSCSSGCRISLAGANVGSSKEPADGQCVMGSGKTGCMAYSIAFYHEEAAGATCKYFYEEKKEANTVAKCAHECKNNAPCKKFSAGPNCAGGCRISKCGSKTHASKAKGFGSKAQCKDDGKCGKGKDDTGCAIYKVTR